MGLFDQYKPQSLLGSEGTGSGFSQPLPTPGKRGATSRLPQRARTTPVDDVEHDLYYGWKSHDLLTDVLLPEARRLVEGRGPVARARDVFRRLEATSVSLRDSVDKVTQHLAALPPDSYFELRERADLLTGAYQALEPDVERMLKRRPSTPSSSAAPSDDPFGLHLPARAPAAPGQDDGERAWAADLDKLDAAELAAAEPQPVHLDQEQCSVEAPAADDAISGIHLFALVKAQLGDRWGTVASSDLAGPGIVGPYNLKPSLSDGGRVNFYLAFHRQRQWPEWVVGPDSIDEFTDNIDHYVGAARASLPGSPRLPLSMQDGADRNGHDPSMLELEARGQAPYQTQAESFEPAVGGDGPNGMPPPSEGQAHGILGTFLAVVEDATAQPNGGSAAVGAWNSHVRVVEYIEPAKRLARELLADVKAGKISHLEARSAAVDGRNAQMRRARGRLSPSGQYASRRIKSDAGVTEPEMVARKVPDILDAAAPEGAGMKVMGEAGDADALKVVLGEESPAWAKYQDALGQGAPRSAVVAQATQELSEQPSVSRAIINSAGKNNKWVTRIARFGRVAGPVMALKEMAEAAETIYDADASQRLHVAAQEGGGFVGGIVGAELGAMAGVWLASVIISGPAAPVVLVVSLIGGMVGAAIGAKVGREAADAIPEAVVDGVNALVTPGSAQAGGYPGLFERSTRAALAKMNVHERLRQAMVDLDEDVAQIDARIAKVEDRNRLDDLHAERFRALSRRDQIGSVYALLRAGKISTVEAWKAVGGEVIEPASSAALAGAQPESQPNTSPLAEIGGGQ